MTGSHQPLLRWLAIIVVALLLIGCRKAPALSGGMFSPSGKYFAYTYMVVTINNYQRTGGRTVSTGWATNYLQVIDTDSGQKLLDKPLKSPCGYPRIGDVSETAVLVMCMASGGDTKRPPSPFVFDLATRRIGVDSKTVAARNPAGLLAGKSEVSANAGSRGQFIVNGSDGRRYRLDPQTGKSERVEGEFSPLVVGVFGFYQGCDLPDGLSERGDTRRYIQRGSDEGSPRSQEDFLKPEFVCADAWELHPLDTASDVDGGILVLSRTSTEEDQHMLLTLVDRATLRTRWSTPLPQTRGNWANQYGQEKFWRRNGRLLVANASQLLAIDPKTGRILRTTNLVE